MQNFASKILKHFCKYYITVQMRNNRYNGSNSKFLQHAKKRADCTVIARLFARLDVLVG